MGSMAIMVFEKRTAFFFRPPPPAILAPLPRGLGPRIRPGLETGSSEPSPTIAKHPCHLRQPRPIARFILLIRVIGRSVFSSSLAVFLPIFKTKTKCKNLTQGGKNGRKRQGKRRVRHHPGIGGIDIVRAGGFVRGAIWSPRRGLGRKARTLFRTSTTVWTRGRPGTLSTATAPSAGPADSRPTVNQIMGKAPAIDDTNGATEADVAEGKTFWRLTAGQWGPSTGSLAAETVENDTVQQGSGHLRGFRPFDYRRGFGELETFWKA